jgi:hypothetical protein
MKSYIFTNHNLEKETYRVRRLIEPLLEQILGKDAPKEVTVDDKNLYINGTAVGEWKKVSNFSVDEDSLRFDYGSDEMDLDQNMDDLADTKYRVIDFGWKAFQPADYYKVHVIWEYEYGKLGNKVIYNRFKEEQEAKEDNN